MHRSFPPPLLTLPPHHPRLTREYDRSRSLAATLAACRFVRGRLAPAFGGLDLDLAGAPRRFAPPLPAAAFAGPVSSRCFSFFFIWFIACVCARACVWHWFG